MGDEGTRRDQTPLIGRDDEVVARILRRWRELTGGKGARDEQRRTLVACSGGADSVALAIALASVAPKPVLGHVVHDLREPAVAAGDRDSVRELAERLGCRFAERSVAVTEQGGNLEANARRERYVALAAMAEEHRCGFVATGHHADDQLETVLMRLIRGTGVRGLRGVAARRELGGVVVVRPMLDVTREELEGLCTRAGERWRHDHTNDDQAMLRNRIRHTLAPELRKVEPAIARRASGLASACGRVSELLERLVDERLMADAEIAGARWAWDRKELRGQEPALLSEMLRLYVQRVLLGGGADTLGRGQIEACVEAIKSGSGEPSEHRVGPMVVRIDAERVVIEPARPQPGQVDLTQEGEDE